MKKFLIILITVILSIPLLSLSLKAEVLGDPNDILTVVTPSANQRVSGSVNITWYMFDNNQNVIPYKINLFDSSTCRTTDFGQINSTNTGISSTTQLNSYSWNTRSTLSTANLADGNYCLKICLAMKNGSGDYAACNARYVRIINNNRAPTITSLPTNLIIRESDSWTYQIQATDPDNDPITYRIVLGVPFLTINPQTGLVSTNSVSKALPAGVNRADYNIIVAADDNFAGAVTQQFVLTIIKDSTVGVPSPTPVSSPNGTVTNQPSVINILNPKEGEIFSGETNKVAWQASDIDGIQSLVINFGQDNITWTQVTKFEGDAIPSEYNWDVSKIKDGNYYLQIVVKDNLGNEVIRSSKLFQINNGANGPGQENNPLIINLKPQDNSEVSDRRTEIAGDFIPADGAEIDASSFTIKLNGQESVLDCQHDDQKFSCIPIHDLNDGLNKVVASIKDKLGRETSVEWSFTVTTSAPVSSPAESGNPDVVIILGREIPRNIFNILLIICCIASLLILIPWILYLLWAGRSKGEEEETTETTTTFDYTPPVDTTTTSSVSLTPQSTDYYTPENYSYSNTTTTEPVKTTTETTETKVEDTTPIVTNNTTVDDYYSYVNPTGTVAPVTENITTEKKTDTVEDQSAATTTTDTYIEPTETS
ncbi:MAG: cadherin repeat domain-containing protein [Candidatus Dojkabacteria bacterium]